MTQKLNIPVVLIVASMAFLLSSCGNKNNINPNIPYGTIRIDIDPNSSFYQELNTVGGWTYVDNGQPGVSITGNSRGVIIYRYTESEFMAYDRMPPNYPNDCCTGNGLCTRLVVGDYYPMVKDTCNGNLYMLVDGSLFKGNGQYPLIRYSAVYDGGLLHIYK
jgi:hypothetical protein